MEVNTLMCDAQVVDLVEADPDELVDLYQNGEISALDRLKDLLESCRSIVGTHFDGNVLYLDLNFPSECCRCDGGSAILSGELCLDCLFELQMGDEPFEQGTGSSVPDDLEHQQFIGEQVS